MRKKQTWIAAFLAILLFITAGCGKSPDSINDNIVVPTAPATEPTGKVAEDASLNSLRQAMVGTPQLFAVAYFGYHETMDSPLPVDPFAVMQENAYWLCREMPFLLEIPEDRIIGEGGDLFCIVPLDEEATVAVNKGYWLAVKVSVTKPLDGPDRMVVLLFDSAFFNNVRHQRFSVVPQIRNAVQSRHDCQFHCTIYPLC